MSPNSPQRPLRKLRYLIFKRSPRSPAVSALDARSVGENCGLGFHWLCPLGAWPLTAVIR